MKKNFFSFIGIGLITGVAMWGLVQASGVQVNNTPSIVDDGTTITFNSSIATNIPTAADNVTGASVGTTGGQGGDCATCGGETSPGGGASLIGGRGGAGDGSDPGGLGGSVTVRGGPGGTDNGGGGGNGGAANISGGQATGGANNGAVNIGTTFPGVVTIGGTSVSVNAPQGGTDGSISLGPAATAFASTRNFQTITGDGGGNTIATITGAPTGMKTTLLFVDALVTVTDDNTHAADSVDLSAAFTSADDSTLTILYDGTSWYEISRSVN